MGFEGERLTRWRQAIDAGAGETIETMVASIPGASIAGLQLKRVPKPFAADHPHEALLRRKGIQVRANFDVPPSMGSEAFVNWCVAKAEQFMPLHQLIVDEMV